MRSWLFAAGFLPNGCLTKHTAAGKGAGEIKVDAARVFPGNPFPCRPSATVQQIVGKPGLRLSQGTTRSRPLRQPVGWRFQVLRDPAAFVRVTAACSEGRIVEAAASLDFVWGG